MGSHPELSASMPGLLHNCSRTVQTSIEVFLMAEQTTEQTTPVCLGLKATGAVENL